jgi:leader peptidase (prepilin peptidase)/N-methyltransferase
LTALWGVVVRVFGGDGAATVPHGPSMCLATAGAAGLALLG